MAEKMKVACSNCGEPFHGTTACNITWHRVTREEVVGKYDIVIAASSKEAKTLITRFEVTTEGDSLYYIILWASKEYRYSGLSEAIRHYNRIKTGVDK